MHKKGICPSKVLASQQYVCSPDESVDFLLIGCDAHFALLVESGIELLDVRVRYISTLHKLVDVFCAHGGTASHEAIGGGRLAKAVGEEPWLLRKVLHDTIFMMEKGS